jgi:hypothetical protein
MVRPPLRMFDAGDHVVGRRGVHAPGELADALPQARRVGLGQQFAFHGVVARQLLEQRVDGIEHGHGRRHARDEDQLDVVAVPEIGRDPERQPHHHRALQHHLERAAARHEAPARDEARVAQPAIDEGEGAQHQRRRQQRRAQRERPPGGHVGPVELPVQRVGAADLVVELAVFGRRGVAGPRERVRVIEGRGLRALAGRQARVGGDARVHGLHELAVLRAQCVFGEDQRRGRNGEEPQQREREDAHEVGLNGAGL